MYKLNTDFEAVVLLERFVLDMSQLQPSKDTSSPATEENIPESEIA